MPEQDRACLDLLGNLEGLHVMGWQEAGKRLFL
jgi:hypothetical protein